MKFGKLCATFLFGSVSLAYQRPYSMLCPLRTRLMSSFKLMMDTPVVLRGLNDVINRYDVFLLDQFGVLHDGANPLPGVKEALETLNTLGKKYLILSNTSSRFKVAEKRYKKLGLPTGYTGFLTSGEACWHFLNAFYKNKKCVWLTWNSHPYDDYLPSLGIETADVESADFVFFHGSQTMITNNNSSTPLTFHSTGIMDEHLTTMLKRAKERKLPAVCANVDLTAVTNGQCYFMPGNFLYKYEELGGEVISFGKPDLPFFDEALRRGFAALDKDFQKDGNTLRKRAVHVGDSLHHDIAGAKAANIDSILITDHGVHREDLLDDEDDEETAEDEESELKFEKVLLPMGKEDEVTSKFEDAESKKHLLIKVTDLCDEEEIGRPTFVMRSFSL